LLNGRSTALSKVTKLTVPVTSQISVRWPANCSHADLFIYHCNSHRHADRPTVRT